MIQTRSLQNVRIHRSKQNKAVRFKPPNLDTEEEYRLKSTRCHVPLSGKQKDYLRTRKKTKKT